MRPLLVAFALLAACPALADDSPLEGLTMDVVDRGETPDEALERMARTRPPRPRTAEAPEGSSAADAAERIREILISASLPQDAGGPIGADRADFDDDNSGHGGDGDDGFGDDDGDDDDGDDDSGEGGGDGDD